VIPTAARADYFPPPSRIGRSAYDKPGFRLSTGKVSATGTTCWQTVRIGQRVRVSARRYAWRAG